MKEKIFKLKTATKSIGLVSRLTEWHWEKILESIEQIEQSSIVEEENKKQPIGHPQIHLGATDGKTVEDATQMVLHKMGDGTLFVEVYYNQEFSDSYKMYNYQFTISSEAFKKMKQFVASSVNYDSFSKESTINPTK